jgi:hypothetical protein
MPIKTFRGQIADTDQDTIVLHTNDGSTGYRIVKLEIMTSEPFAGATSEHVLKVWSKEQTTPYTDFTVDFSDQILLAAAITTNHTTGYANPLPVVVVFDNVIFNQDIYITHTDSSNSQALNYHLELEQIKLSLDENTVATLKDIRNNTAPI